MEAVIEYRNLAAKLRGEAAGMAKSKARKAKLAAALEWEMLARQIETVIGPNNECLIGERID